MIKDSIIPTNQDLSYHEIIESGASPQRSYTAHFYYEDGSVRSYDGRAWKLVVPAPKLEIYTDIQNDEEIRNQLESQGITEWSN